MSITVNLKNTQFTVNDIVGSSVSCYFFHALEKFSGLEMRLRRCRELMRTVNFFRWRTVSSEFVRANTFEHATLVCLRGFRESYQAVMSNRLATRHQRNRIYNTL